MEFPKLPSKPPMFVGEALTPIWRQRDQVIALSRSLMMMMSPVRLTDSLLSGQEGLDCYL